MEWQLQSRIGQIENTMFDYGWQDRFLLFFLQAVILAIEIVGYYSEWYDKTVRELV